MPATPVSHRAFRRFSSAAPALILLVGCTIEPTPQQYIDRQPASAEQAAIAASELRGRLMDLSAALEAGDRLAVEELLLPQQEATVFGPGSGELSRGPVEAVEALMTTAHPSPYTAHEIVVNTGPQNNVAWFHAAYSGPASDGEFRFTGVFRRQEGQWRLAQGHLTRFPASASP